MDLSFILNHIAQLCEAKRFKEAHGAINVGLMHYPRHPELIGYFSKIPGQYDESFFGDAYATSYLSAKLMFNHLNKHFLFDSVVDVGAGVGAWSRAALEMNKAVTSIDGEWVSSIPDKFPGLNYLFQDLNKKISVSSLHDVAVCVEVAEHLLPERSSGIVADLCSLAPVVVFGAALPRQGGAGHINCRPHSFWINAFSEHDYAVIDLFRPKFWYDGHVGPWYSQNTYLFVAPEKSSQFSGFSKPSLVDVYHPKIVLDSPMCLQDHLTGNIDPGDQYKI
jgi:hypothetical protein